jgi:hypothetical protein
MTTSSRGSGHRVAKLRLVHVDREYHNAPPVTEQVRFVLDCLIEVLFLLCFARTVVVHHVFHCVQFTLSSAAPVCGRFLGDDYHKFPV